MTLNTTEAHCGFRIAPACRPGRDCGSAQRLRISHSAFRIGLVGLALLAWPVAAWAEIAMKILVVNPSETEVKEYDIKSPLPPEVKPEHVLNADGFRIEYDSQASVYMLVGTLTLKPKEVLSRKVVLEDVWIVPMKRLANLRQEVAEIVTQLAGSAYEEQGRLLASAIARHLTGIEASQEERFVVNPEQHISRYREHLKTLQMVESDLVSLRQLMVMAKLAASAPSPVLETAAVGAEGHERGQLSVLATWRLIFLILGLLGFVSLTFFLIWQRQLRLQLAKHAPAAEDDALDAVSHGKTNGHSAPSAAPPASPLAARVQPKSPLSS